VTINLTDDRILNFFFLAGLRLKRQRKNEKQEANELGDLKKFPHPE
jgi:hypothetical protein